MSLCSIIYSTFLAPLRTLLEAIYLTLYQPWKVPQKWIPAIRQDVGPRHVVWAIPQRKSTTWHKVHSHTTLLVFRGLHSSMSTRLIQCTLLKLCSSENTATVKLAFKCVLYVHNAVAHNVSYAVVLLPFHCSQNSWARAADSASVDSGELAFPDLHWFVSHCPDYPLKRANSHELHKTIHNVQIACMC